MDKIQEKITEKGRRNWLSRVIHAKSDKDAVAAWKLDLNRILHIFNVRFITNLWSSLTVHFQTQLAINTNVVISDVRRDVQNTQTIVSCVHHNATNIHTVVSNIHNDVANTQTVVSDVHQGVVNTQAIVSDIHRAVVKGRDEADNKHLSVSVTCTMSIAQSMLTIH